MPLHTTVADFSSLFSDNPLQSTKFVGCLLSLALGVAGFFRIIDPRMLLDMPMGGDSQFLALILVPLVSLLLVFVVFLETLHTGYRVILSNDSITDQIAGQFGYILVRGIEAVIAFIGVTIIFTAFPVLLAESTPAPAGVGLMLLFMLVGISILIASLVRSGAELFIYRETAMVD